MADDKTPDDSTSDDAVAGDEVSPNVIIQTDLQEALKKGIRIVPVAIENQMKEAYLDYAMSVIVGRALPDVRDGLKPVHRRILFAMHDRAWRHDRPFVKCAKIVGEVIGNFHPHGDTAIYDTMVRMAQEFSLRVPLIDGQGNFGSVDGDNPAAYRYTEARLTRQAEELLRDIDRQTVDFANNFDDTKQEPRVLPAAFPNLLVNGSTGIAVGMSTNIPPHNFTEVMNAVLALIENPELTNDDLMKFIPAPDFPTGGIIIGGEGIRSAYRTGRGSFTIRSQTNIETGKKGRDTIFVTEIPYQVNKRTLLEKIAFLVNEKKIEGISDVRDLSDRHGIRIRIELKKDVNAQVILNQLYKQTQLQISYGIIMLALVEGRPRVLSLRDILTTYVSHRKEVIVRRTEFELDRADKRAHILEGLKIALDFIDEVIKIIRGSSVVEDARRGLMDRFSLSEIQANAILDMRLQKLTSLESQKIIDELKEIKERIEEYRDILAKETRQYSIVSSELGELAEKYKSKRKTEVDHSAAASLNFEVTDLIAEEEMVITVTGDGFIKRMPLDSFRRQRRGGRGVKGGGVKREDAVKMMTQASTHDNLFLFSNRGKVFGLKVHELPQRARDSRGKSLKALINLSSEERITAICGFAAFNDHQAFVMMSRKGILKKSALDIFSSARKGGIIAVGLRGDDELIDVRLVEPEDDIIICSRMGNALRTNLGSMRSQGRTASGVIGIRLAEDDIVIGMDVVRDDRALFVVSEKGFGKRVAYENFTAKGRGGKGMTYIKVSEKNGPAVGVASVVPADDVLVFAKSGMTIRMNAGEVSQIGRATVGVRLLNIGDDDLVLDLAVISED